MKKIVFIGAPASGKSSVLNILSRAVNSRYRSKITFVSEAAREIIDVTPDKVLSEMTPLVFQYEVYKLQLEKENTHNKKCEYMICDRGIADAFVYLSENEVRAFLPYEKEDALGEYDLVVFFFGSEKNFMDDNSIRRESDYVQIKYLENKSWEVWHDHPNVFTVNQSETIYLKALTVGKAINLHLGVEIFDLNKIAKMDNKQL